MVQPISEAKRAHRRWLYTHGQEALAGHALTFAATSGIAHRIAKLRAVTEPWKFYDLGHGYCTYDFFDQCPHRMACAKCSFYLPKDSTKALLLEAKTNLLRLRQDIPLGEAELSAVEDGLSAYEQLLAKLADVPTPGGPTPRQLSQEHLVQLQVGEQPTRCGHR